MSFEKPAPFLFGNDNLKLCAVCGLEKELSFEHFPPKATGNHKPVNVKGLEHFVEAGGYKYGKFDRSPKGFGRYSLCIDCNNLTGAWYANSYIDLSNLILDQMGKGYPTSFIVEGKYKPLNFLKQVVTILLSADQATGLLRSKIQETNFILDKYNRLLSDEIFISMYITSEDLKMLKGYTVELNVGEEVKSSIDFIYKPFRFKVSFDSAQIPPNSCLLNNLVNYEYNQVVPFYMDVK